MKGVRIVSGDTPGLGYGTRVFDEQGNRIEGVRRVEIDVLPDRVHAVITANVTHFDIQAQAEIITVCPDCERPLEPKK